MTDEGNRRMWNRRRKRIEGPTKYVRVSMSEVERAQLHKLEVETGLSPSALLMEGVFGNADPRSVQLRREQLIELVALRRYMATIANNVNQVARHFNSTGEIGREATETLREARTFGQRVLAKIEDLTP